MSDQTKIEWATHTFNPWIGCMKVSPGCAHCYAEARDKRFTGGAHWGKGAPRQRTSAATWRNPVKWNREVFRDAPTHGTKKRYRVFPSLCDWLDDEVPIEWLADFLKLIHDTPHLDWLLLTKRPENWRERLCMAGDWMLCNDRVKDYESSVHTWIHATPYPPENVWLGVSVEDQKRADERIPILISIPAKVRFLSVEPLLSPVNLTGNEKREIWPWSEANAEGHGINWVIVGGESGPKARPCNVKWIRSIVQQCKVAGVPCFVKQLGGNIVSDGITIPGQRWPESRVLCPLTDIGGQWRHNLIHKKGGDPSEWPEDLRVREFPNSATK